MAINFKKMTKETYASITNARTLINETKHELALLEIDINGEGDIKELDDIKKQIKNLKEVISQYDNNLKQYEF